MKESVQFKPEPPLHERMLQFDKLAEMSDELQCIIQPDGCFAYVNPAFSRLLGYQEDDLLSQKLYELVHPEDTESLGRVFINRPCNGAIEDLELRCQHHDGAYRKLQWRISSPKTDGCYYAIAKDITINTLCENLDLEKFELVLNSAIDAIYIIDDNGNIIYANDYACDMLGYEREKLLKKSLYEISPGVTPEAFLENRNKALDGVERTDESLHRRIDGELIPVEIRSSIKTIGGIKYSCTIVRDITGRKAAARLMEELQFAMDNAMDAVYISTNEGRIHYVNNSACQALGYSRDELTDMTLMDIDPGLNREIFAEHTRLSREGQMQSTESFHKRIDGIVFPVEISFIVKTFQDTEYVIAFVRDISERKRAAKDLLIYEQIVNASSDAMFFIDRQYKYRAVNQKFLDVFATTRADVIGREVPEIMGQDHFFNYSKPSLEECWAGKTVNYQSWFDDVAGGPSRCIDMSYIPHVQDDGSISGAVVSAHDITGLTEVQLQLEKSEKQLKQAQTLARMGSWEWDITNNRSFMSEETFNIFNMDEDELGTELEDFIARIHEDDRDYVMESLNAALGDDRPYNLDYRIVLSDGAVRHIHAQGEVHRDATGAAMGMFGTVQDVTDRYQVLEELKESEARFKSLFERSAVGMAVFSPDSCLVMANSAFHRMLGYKRGELAGYTSFSITHQDDRDKHVELMQQLVNGEIDHYTIDKRYLRKNRELVWGRTTVSIVHDEHGQILYFIKQIQDISKAKEAIRQSEELRNAIDNSIDAVILFNRNGEIYYVNQSACNELGYSREEFSSMTLFDIDPDLTTDGFNEIWDWASGERAFFERRHRRKDGTCFPVEISSSVQEFEGSRYACSFSRNISDRKQATRQMQELKFAMENAVDAVYLFDTSGLIFYVNKSAVELTGYSYEELTAMNVLDFDPAFPRDQWQEYVDRARNYGKISLETVHRRKDGKLVDVEITGNIKTFDGQEFLCTFARDITDRKKQSREMEELRFAVDNAVDAVFLTRPSGEIFYVNQSACDSLGYTKQELVGMNTADIDPNLTEGIRADYRASTDARKTVETMHIRKDGTTFPVELTFKFNKQDESGYSCAIVRDISERKLSARKMEELQFAIENSTDGVIIYTQDASIRYVNDSFCRTLGYSFEELTSMALFDISISLNADDWPERWQSTMEYYKRGEQRLVEDDYNCRDGTVYPVEVSISYAEFGGVMYGYGFVRDISERKKAARQMEELQFAVMNATDGVVIYNEDASIHYANKSMCDALGYTYDELTSMSLFDIAAELNEEIWPERWRTSLDFREKGTARLVETRHIRKDGTEFPVEIASNYAEFGGNAYGYSFVRDITKRKADERQMQMLNFAIENATEALYVIDEDSRIIYVNNYVYEQTGYTKDEIIGGYVTDLDPDMTREKWKDNWRIGIEYARAGKTRLLEGRHRKKDGTIIPIEVSVYHAVFEGTGYRFTFIRDITERKRIARQTEELRFAIDNAIDAVYLNNRDGQIYYVNKSACQQLGYSYEELTSMNIADIDPNFSRDLLNTSLDSPDVEPIIPPEAWHFRKDGTKFPVEVSFNSREYEGIEYLCSFARDITDRVQTQRELQQYQEHLEELVGSRTMELKDAQEKLVQKEKLAVLGQLTGVVSHELRNPLGTIRSSVYLLRDKIDDKTGLIDRAINRAERNIVRCDQIIEELLDYARAPQTVMKSVQLDLWLEDVLQEYEFPREVSVHKKLQAGITILLETDRFERCIINVLSNACEAMQEMPEHHHHLLQIQTRVEDMDVEILIIDNGPGIAEELQERIFEPLFSTKGFGVGLGLPIVEQIIQQHNGKVSIASDREKGTVVTLRLPIKHINQKEPV